MPEVEIKVPNQKAEIEVYCAECGYGLCNVSSGGIECIEVRPCPRCIKEAREEGQEQGLGVAEQIEKEE